MHNAMLVEVDPTLLRVLIDGHAWLTRCTGNLCWAPIFSRQIRVCHDESNTASHLRLGCCDCSCCIGESQPNADLLRSACQIERGT